MSTEILVKPPETTPSETSEVVLDSARTLYFANGLQPIGIESLDVGRAEPLDIQVFARISTEGRYDIPSSRYVIGKINTGKNEKFVAIRTSSDRNEEPKAYKLPSLGVEAKENESLPIEDIGSLRFTRDETKHKGWLGLRLSSRPGVYSGVKVEVAEASHPKVEFDYELRKKKESVKKWKKVGAVALGLLAFRAVTAPGGIQDKVLDPSHDSHEYVLDNLRADPADIPANGIEADGVHFSRQEVLKWSEYKTAERVARTMGDLDGHRYEDIKDRAEAFVAEHRGEILTPDQIESIKAQLDEASSIDQLKQATKRLSDHFGIDFKMRESADLSRAKYMVNGALEALGPLPASLVKSAFSAGRGAINLAPKRDEVPESDSVYGSAVAYFGSNEIVLLGSGKIGVGPLKITLADIKDILLHELGHGLQKGNNLNLNNSASDGSIGAIATGLASRIISHPKYTSFYATKEPGEETSETIREVLQGNIADPDHVGEFESRANSLRLSILEQLEEKYPGITDYLVTLNPGLLES